MQTNPVFAMIIFTGLPIGFLRNYDLVKGSPFDFGQRILPQVEDDIVN
jgi:hypothetical protein